MSVPGKKNEPERFSNLLTDKKLTPTFWPKRGEGGGKKRGGPESSSSNFSKGGGGKGQGAVSISSLRFFFWCRDAKCVVSSPPRLTPRGGRGGYCYKERADEVRNIALCFWNSGFVQTRGEKKVTAPQA